MTFAELIQSRRSWIDDILKPWCVTANRKDLILATQSWTDLAGEVDPEHTLFIWAWSRFPVLVHDQMTTLNETSRVVVRLKDEREIVGFPDARRSAGGMLQLLTDNQTEPEPVSIDDVVAVTREAE